MRADAFREFLAAGQYDCLRLSSPTGSRIVELVPGEPGREQRAIAPVAAPVPYDYFLRHQKFLKREQSVVLLMVALAQTRDRAALAEIFRRAGGTA